MKKYDPERFERNSIDFGAFAVFKRLFWGPFGLSEEEKKK